MSAGICNYSISNLLLYRIQTEVSDFRKKITYDIRLVLDQHAELEVNMSRTYYSDSEPFSLFLRA